MRGDSPSLTPSPLGHFSVNQLLIYLSVVLAFVKSSSRSLQAKSISLYMEVFSMFCERLALGVLIVELIDQ